MTVSVEQSYNMPMCLVTTMTCLWFTHEMMKEKRTMTENKPVRLKMRAAILGFIPNAHLYLKTMKAVESFR